MAEFAEVMKQKARMCDYNYHKAGCVSCPLSGHNNSLSKSCGVLFKDHPKQAEEIIMQWVKEHPIKTNKDKFEEVFGKLNELNMTTAYDCVGIACNGRNCVTCEDNGFWNREYKEPK